MDLSEKKGLVKKAFSDVVRKSFGATDAGQHPVEMRRVEGGTTGAVLGLSEYSNTIVSFRMFILA